ncbi:MAG TPA: DUF996 domain-containing protein [Candidatus Bathyarchaeia archaeon]|nr:DUF996 domain-containing protein [Candidatus Bathyarchaeia archaeon]
MASLSRAKTLGGVGSILVLLGAIPNVGFVLAIIGFILILVAVKNVSESVNEPGIFSNMIIAVLLAIVGLVVFGVIVIAAFLSFFNFGRVGTFTPGTVPPGFLGAIGLLIVGLVVVWVFYLVSAIFIRKSYDRIGLRLNVNMFQTTGLLYLIGAALTIVLVGILIILIAEILQIVAFFSIPDQLPPSMPPQQSWGPPTPPAPMPPSQPPTQ